jgi:hypothetical protein
MSRPKKSQAGFGEARARSWIDANVPLLMVELGIEDWAVSFKSKRLPKGYQAMCSPMAEYRSASIEYDPRQIDSADEFARVILHELCHVVLAPMCYVDQMMTASAGEDSIRGEMLAESFRQAIEQTVASVMKVHERTKGAARG